MIWPELEDQAFPFQRSLAFAEDIFHLVVPLEIEVYEILVDASVQRSVLYPYLKLTHYEVSILPESNVSGNPHVQVIIVEIRARNDVPSTVEVHSPYSIWRESFHSNDAESGYKVGFATGSLLHSVAKAMIDVSGVRVFDRGREDIGRWSENVSSLPHSRGL